MRRIGDIPTQRLKWDRNINLFGIVWKNRSSTKLKSKNWYCQLFWNLLGFLGSLRCICMKHSWNFCSHINVILTSFIIFYFLFLISLFRCAFQILIQMQEIWLAMPTLVHIIVLDTWHFIVYGDIHGHVQQNYL